MNEDDKTFSEEEFALVLKKASDLAREPSPPPNVSTGLTLEDMESAAAEAETDPAIVESAAGIIPAVSGGSFLQRLLGGSFSSRVDLRFPGKLRQEDSDHLLGLVRSVAGYEGEGEAYPSLMTWTFEKDGRISASAYSEGDQTTVHLVVNNRPRLVRTLTSAAVGAIFVLILAVELGPTGPGGSWAFHALPYAILCSGVTGISALAWRSLRKTVRATRRTIQGLAEAISRFLSKGEAS